MLVSPHAKKSLFISFMVLTLNFSSCTIVILSYVTDIFTKTGSSLSPKSSSLLISITQITANLVLLNIVERVNRRVCHAHWYLSNDTSSILWKVLFRLLKSWEVVIQFFDLNFWISEFDAEIEIHKINKSLFCV